MNDPGNPLQGLLGDLLKVIGGAQGGGTPWLEAARALAHGVATDGAPEANADPIQRIKLEDLARIAELHVAEASGLPRGAGDRSPSVTPVGRGAWALQTLDAWAPLLEQIVAAQGPPTLPPGLGGEGDPLDGGEAGGIGDLLGKFASTLGPVLLGMQFGSAAGHLAQRALGQYVLPIPRPGSDELLVVPENIDRFASDWSLPSDQTQLWVCIHELTAHAVLSIPHVADRVHSLLAEVAAASSAVQQGLMERLAGGSGGSGGSGDSESLESLLSDPESLLADLVTPGQRRTSADLIALTCALEGYVDHITARVAGSLIGSPAALVEAWYRYRAADAGEEQGAGALFGLDLGRAQVDRGAAFVRGVIERSGEDGLARLWHSPRTLPTPAEVDAPGLWLERIDLPDEAIGEGPRHEP